MTVADIQKALFSLNEIVVEEVEGDRVVIQLRDRSLEKKLIRIERCLKALLNVKSLDLRLRAIDDKNKRTERNVLG